MRGLRQIVPAFGLATAIMAAAFAVSAVYAGSPPATPAASSDAYDALDATGPGDMAALGGAAGSPEGSGAPGWCHGPHGHGALGPIGHLLHRLNLTADQKAQIKSIMVGQKSRFDALHQSAKTNLHALATTPPTDPGYPVLIQTAQSDAGSRIALMSDTWKQIYESVLTPAQRDQIPSLVAAVEQARASGMGNWKAPAVPSH